MSFAPSVILAADRELARAAAAGGGAATSDVFSTTVFRMPRSGEVGPDEDAERVRVLLDGRERHDFKVVQQVVPGPGCSPARRAP